MAECLFFFQLDERSLARSFLGVPNQPRIVTNLLPYFANNPIP